MDPVALVENLLLDIHHILATVPLTPGTRPTEFFLDIYKLTYADIKQLEINEKSWEAYRQVPVNKLLKLSISFGNLVKTFQLEKTQHEAKKKAQRTPKLKSRQSVDPFLDSFTNEKDEALNVAPYHITFLKNFFLVLKNFDIGSAAGGKGVNGGFHSNSLPPNSRLSQVSRSTMVDSEVASISNNSINGASAMHTGSPIRLNSRQLLIEKLEINISLDALFTFKINLKLLTQLLTIVKELLGNYSSGDEATDAAPGKGQSDASSIFSCLSDALSKIDMILSTEDYARLVGEVVRRVNLGIIEPFMGLLKDQVVKPNVLSGFQNLVETI